MSEQIPNVPARLVSPAARGQDWTFRVKCCYCGRTHIHGAGPSAADAHLYYGQRVAHCVDIYRGSKLVFDSSTVRGKRYNLVPAVDYDG